MYKSLIASMLLLVSAASVPAMAGSRGDQILGAAIGAAAGAAVGGSISGRDGAVVGGVLGGLVGASIAGQDRRHERDYDRRYVDYSGRDRHYDRGRGRYERYVPAYAYDDGRGGRGHRHHHDRYCRD